jgi:hypothetical protein
MMNLKSNDTLIRLPTGMGKNNFTQLLGRVPRKPSIPLPVAQVFAHVCGFATPKAWLTWVMAY